MASLRLRRLVRLPGHELRPREQRLLRLASTDAAVESYRSCDDLRHHRFERGPIPFDEQRLSLRRDLLRLSKDRLDRARQTWHRPLPLCG